MAVRYVAQTGDCWLLVKMGTGELASLPFGLKVNSLEIKDGREHFEILEGVHKGERASVISRAGQSYLADLSHSKGETVRFDRAKQTLSIGSLGTFNAFSGGGHRGFTQVAAGTHLLAIPAYPSKQTRAAYRTWTKWHNVWFRIGTSTAGSRFLHPGAISDGCVTVRQFVYDPASGAPPTGFNDLVGGARSEPGLLGLPLPSVRAATMGWDKVVAALILCRKSDQAVGELVVT
jgi:hypothetical protein